MSKIEKTLYLLDRMEYNPAESGKRFDTRAMLLVTVFYLIIMLSVPIGHIDMLLWFALYPIVAAPMAGIKYSTILLQSFIVLPFILLLGIFNPIIDREPAIIVDNIVITKGWIDFIGFILRGLLSMQALLLLINTVGFIGLIRSMEKIGIPKFLTTQLQMVYRYIKVLIEEASMMRNAIMARSFDRKHLPLKMWGRLIGQLFIRSVDRSEHIHRAMLARGFNGSIPSFEIANQKWMSSDTLYLICWSLIFVFLRIFNLSLLFVK